MSILRPDAATSPPTDDHDDLSRKAWRYGCDLRVLSRRLRLDAGAAVEMKKYTFDAEIRAGRGGGAYVVFPYDARERVRDERQGAGQRDDRRRAGQERAHAHGNSASHARRAQSDPRQIGKQPGDAVKIVLWKDDEPREVAVPPELRRA